MSEFFVFKVKEIALAILILIGIAIFCELMSGCSSQVVTTPGGAVGRINLQSPRS